MIDRFERFSQTISEISRYWHKIAADEMEKYDLKGPCAVYFTAMYRCPEGITAARLGEVCARDKSDVSRSVADMERRGLVCRESGGNRYRALLTLTEEGRQVAEEINRRAALAVEFGGRGLSDEQREVFYDALERIANNLQVVSEQGLPRNG